MSRTREENALDLAHEELEHAYQDYMSTRSERTLEGMIDRALKRKLAERRLELADQLPLEQQRAQANPYTWRELSSAMQHTLDELSALTNNGMIPESLSHAADALDTALCDMQYQLHCWLGEDDGGA